MWTKFGVDEWPSKTKLGIITYYKLQQKKLERVEEVKEARLKEVGYKRPFWGGHTAPIFINSYPKAFNVGEPVPPEYEIGEKVNLAL